MAYNKIQTLLEKYWEGTTSLQEEQQLRSYFNGDNVADDLKRYQPLFQFFQTKSEEKLSDDFSEKILKNISSNPPKGVVRNMYQKLGRIAAIGLLAMITYFAYSQLNYDKAIERKANIVVFDDNPEDVKAAYLAYKEALQLVSRKMDKGTKKAAYGFGQVRKATKIIRE